ncbi:hypothetical protein BKA93DRAFT_785540 [Sparassis latifolia]
MVCAVVGDLIITASIFWYLRGHKSGWTKTDKIVDEIIRNTIQNGLLTSAVATVELLLYLVETAPNYIVSCLRSTRERHIAMAHHLLSRVPSARVCCVTDRLQNYWSTSSRIRWPMTRGRRQTGTTRRRWFSRVQRTVWYSPYHPFGQFASPIASCGGTFLSPSKS